MAASLELDKDIRLTENGLGIFIKEHSALVIADLHIGLEFALMGEGTYLPVLQYPTIEKSILEMVAKYSPSRVIINGDFKHEFAKATNQEWTEILNLWDALAGNFVELDLVRGNHDNYLINVLKQRKKSIYDPSLNLGKYQIAHGHKTFEIAEDAKTIILAHEHPAIGFLDETGGKHKFKCFLVGEHEGCRIIVLPAFSPLSIGAVINSGKNQGFMSPFLSNIDASALTPVVVDSGELLRFPPVSEIEPIRLTADLYDLPELDY
jgi:putative SbcD/Mre11-related phosphoesterase